MIINNKTILKFAVLVPGIICLLTSCKEENTSLNKGVISETKLYSGSGNGKGIIEISGNCRSELTSKTERLTITVNLEDGNLISGEYILIISTASNPETNCNIFTFNETKTGVINIISKDTFRFNVAIGTSAQLNNVFYNYEGQITETIIKGKVEHTSNALLSSIKYDLNLSMP